MVNALQEELEDERSITKKMKFMTSKEEALQAVDSAMISTKAQRVVVGNKSLVERELGQVPS